MSRSPETWASWTALLLVTVAACAAKDGGPSVDAAVWRDAARRDLPAALPADAMCGLPGGRCCPGNLCAEMGEGAACCVGEMCVAPGTACGMVPGTCSKGSCGSCGSLGQPCCAGGACTALGTRCEAGSCVACGHLGEACCPRSSCLTQGTTCSTSVGGSSVGQCVACGEPGLRCCAGACAGEACCVTSGGNDRCVAAGRSCGEIEGTCRDKQCSGGMAAEPVACGEEDQPCCMNRCNGARLGCDPAKRTCTRQCGGQGQPCCRNGCDQSLACINELDIFGNPGVGLCRACGGAGQACCPSFLAGCQGGGCCISGLCVPAGTACQARLQSYGMCENGLCNGCGQAGQPCCSSQIRNQPACGSLFMMMPAEVLACIVTVADPMAMPPQPQQTCSVCGGSGQPCCPGSRCPGGCCIRASLADNGTCVAENGACPGGGVCRGGSCGTCGAAGQKCCTGSLCSAPQTTCRAIAGQGEVCQTCGNRGEPCCFDQLSGSNCATQQLTCRNGFCVER